VSEIPQEVISNGLDELIEKLDAEYRRPGEFTAEEFRVQSEAQLEHEVTIDEARRFLAARVRKGELARRKGRANGHGQWLYRLPDGGS